MTTAKVETYRLWPDGTWDKVEVEVMAEPWKLEVIESRAVTVAWKQLIAEEVKPLQIGLYMPSIKEPLT